MKRFLYALVVVLAAAPCFAGTRDLKEDTAVVVVVGPFVDSTGAAVTAPTIASIDITGYKNDGTAVGITPAASGSSNDMVHVDDGYFSLELTTTDTSTPGFYRLTFQISGSLIFHEDFSVLPANIYDSKYSTDKLEVDVAQFGGSNGTFASGRAEVNVSHWLGTAAATPTVAGVPEVDISHLLGTAVATPHTNGYFPSTIKDGQGTGELDTTDGQVVARNGNPGRVWYVDDTDGAGDTGTYEAPFDTIQAGHDAAAPGDVIFVFPGTYAATAVSTPGLTIIGSGDATVVTSSSSITLQLTSAADNCVLRNLKVVQTNTANLSLDVRNTANVTIDGVWSTGGQDGLLASGTTGLKVLRSRFTGDWDGGNFSLSAGLFVDGCTFVAEGDYDASLQCRAVLASAAVGEIRNCSLSSQRAVEATGRSNAFAGNDEEPGVADSKGALTLRNCRLFASQTDNSSTGGVTLVGPATGLAGPVNVNLVNCTFDRINDGSGGTSLDIDANISGSYVRLQGATLSALATSGTANIFQADRVASETLVDTGTTLDDFVDGIETSLADGTSGLVAIKTAIDGISAGTSPTILVATQAITVTNQTTIVLTDGPPDNDVLNGHTAIFVDQSNPLQVSSVQILDYVGSTETMTLATAIGFTAATGDFCTVVSAPPATVSGTVDANLLTVEGSDASNTIRDAPWTATTRELSGTIGDFDTLVDGAEDFDGAFQASATTFFGATGGNLTSLASQASVDTIDNFVDDLEGRVTATRAGYWDNLSAGAVATAATQTTQGGQLTNLLTAFELDGSVYRLTTNALEQAPAGEGGSGATPAQIWAFALSGETGAGTASKALQDVLADTTNLPDDPADQSVTTLAVNDAKDAVLDELASLEVTGVADFTDTQQNQILAALSVSGDIGVPKALIWTVQRRDGQVGSTFPVVIDPEDDVYVACNFAGVLGQSDAIEDVVSVSLVDSDETDDVESPAFEDVNEAEIWMGTRVKFKLTGGTNNVRDQIKIRVLTEGGNTINANVYALPKDQ